jgi:hypothetical protein
VVTTARLPAFDFGFFGHTPTWDGAEEAVIARAGGEVWGLVLQLGPFEAERMDNMQNVHGDGSGGYFHFPADVEGADGQRHSTLLYMRTAFGEPRPPSVEYRDRLVAGALAHGLPASYIARLRAFEAVPAGYPVPHGLRVFPLATEHSPCSF